MYSPEQAFLHASITYTKPKGTDATTTCSLPSRNSTSTLSLVASLVDAVNISTTPLQVWRSPLKALSPSLLSSDDHTLYTDLYDLVVK